MVAVCQQDKLPSRSFSFWKWLWANLSVAKNLVNNEWRAEYVRSHATSLVFCITIMSLPVGCNHLCPPLPFAVTRPRDRPKFGFGFGYGSETGDIFSFGYGVIAKHGFGLLSVTAETTTRFQHEPKLSLLAIR